MATSVLNPNAPIFVPSVYRAVEDFSDQWWDLVQSSPWFRDYWLHECFSDPQSDLSPILEDGEDNDNDYHILDDGHIGDPVTEGKESGTDLVALGWLKWRKPRGDMEVPRYYDKAPRFVNMKVKPRPIQQPR